MKNENYTILIAEDSATQAEILTSILENQGYNVLHEENGKEALNLAKKNPPALIISDVLMPEMDGYVFCEAVREEPSLSQIPFLLLTTLSSPGDLIRGLQAGADSYLVKPYEEAELLEWVEKLLHPQKPSGTSINPRLENFLVSTYQTAMKKNIELRKAKEIAEQADRLKSAFLNNLSHEIRTPMNAILGFSTFIGDPDITDEERTEFASHIETGCANLLGIIDSIVDLSVIESETIEPSLTECRINAFLESVKNEFVEKEKHQMDQLLFRLITANKEEHFTILIDQSRTKKVLNNLLKNALKFTESGFIELGYTLDNPGFIELFVRDSGTGIPNDKIHLIFDKFTKLEEFHTKKYSGTGVGLTITKKLVEFLWGEIRVESTVGEGSLFTVSLPLNIPEQVLGKPSLEIEALEGEAVNWSDRRILIAEDVESNFMLIEHLLKKTHVDILWAKNGKEAVEMCSNGKEIDLILMDIQMPVMDGYTAVELILKMGKGIPIVAQTAYALSHDEEQILDAGFSDLLTKPIKATELMEKITRIFER